MPKTLARGRSYKVAVQQLAGIASGSSYGDDQQSDTNFPLVRIVNDKTRHVFYARIPRASARGASSRRRHRRQASCVPTAGRIETGASSLFVVANGVQSKAVPVTIKWGSRRRATAEAGGTLLSLVRLHR